MCGSPLVRSLGGELTGASTCKQVLRPVPPGCDNSSASTQAEQAGERYS